jgi:hypothetical protein
VGAGGPGYQRKSPGGKLTWHCRPDHHLNSEKLTGGSHLRLVKTVGDMLAQHFPFKANDTNELKNLIIEYIFIIMHQLLRGKENENNPVTFMFGYFGDNCCLFFRYGSR